MRMASSEGEVVIFTDTDMGTHIAISVSPHITASAFMREVERSHFSCFPQLGEIKAKKLMVRRKTYLYLLPESLPIKYAFQGLRGNWFLRVEIRPLNDSAMPCLSESLSAKSCDQISDDNKIIDSIVAETEVDEMACHSDKKSVKNFPVMPLDDELKSIPCLKKKKKKMKRLLQDGSDISDKEHPNRKKKVPGVAAQGALTFPISRNDVEPVIGSNSAIVKHTVERSKENYSSFYFASKRRNLRNSMATSIATESLLQSLKTQRDINCSNLEFYSLPQFAVSTPPRKSHSVLSTNFRLRSSGNKLKKRTGGVGKRILTAANNLRISMNKQKPAVSFYRCALSAVSTVRNSVFEISDNED